jgi:hypothetical protein
MGIAEWFDTFNSNIRMSNSIVENISYRYKRITSQNITYYFTAVRLISKSLKT